MPLETYYGESSTSTAMWNMFLEPIEFPRPHWHATFNPYVWVGNALVSTAGQTQWFTYLNWFASMYLGWRGSTRHKVQVVAPRSNMADSSGTIWSQATPKELFFMGHAGVTNRKSLSIATLGMELPYLASTEFATLSGLQASDIYQAAGGEVTMPFYYPRRFNLCRVVNMAGTCSDTSLAIGVRNWLGTHNGVSSIPHMIRWQGAGADFTFLRFRFIPGVSQGP